MLNNSFKELKEIITNKDLESYLEFVNSPSEGIEKDMNIVDFDILVKKTEGWFESPSNYLTYKLNKILLLASKYNLNFDDLYNEALTRGKIK